MGRVYPFFLFFSPEYCVCFGRPKTKDKSDTNEDDDDTHKRRRRRRVSKAKRERERERERSNSPAITKEAFFRREKVRRRRLIIFFIIQKNGYDGCGFGRDVAASSSARVSVLEMFQSSADSNDSRESRRNGRYLFNRGDVSSRRVGKNWTRSRRGEDFIFRGERRVDAAEFTGCGVQRSRKRRHE